VIKKIIDVTAAVIVKDGKVLAARRGPGKHLEGYWEFPGGKLEENESPENCLERELTEEFSISTRVGVYIGESVYDYGEKVVRLLGYEVEHSAGDFKLVDHDELRWLEIDQLADVKWAPADIPLVEQYESRARVVGYYSTKAIEYCEETSGYDVGHLYRPFLEYMAPGAHILDLGCGSGRDSKAFREMGYNVTSVDGSPEIAAWASAFTGHPVTVKSFHDIDYTEEFDGVWASACL
jgi:mutator protein MutT